MGTHFHYHKLGMSIKLYVLLVILTLDPVHCLSHTITINLNQHYVQCDTRNCLQDLQYIFINPIKTSLPLLQCY